MRRFVIPFMLVGMLTGCTYKNAPLDAMLAFREKMLMSKGVRFEAEVTADYLDELTVFGMSCEADHLGNMSFSVTSPQTIEGITGSVLDDEINLTFDDTVLAFQPVPNENFSPVSAPWILTKALRSGYIRAGASMDSGFSASIQDSYDENAMLLEILFDESSVPYFAEIYSNDRRILSIKIEAFQML